MIRITLALAPLALLAACAPTSTPNYDMHFGQAVRNAVQMQVLDPAAATRPQAFVGMDGKSAAEAMGRYQESFKTPPPVVNVINIGGSMSSGGNGSGSGN